MSNGPGRKPKKTAPKQDSIPNESGFAGTVTNFPREASPPPVYSNHGVIEDTYPGSNAKLGYYEESSAMTPASIATITMMQIMSGTSLTGKVRRIRESEYNNKFGGEAVLLHRRKK